MYHIWADPAHYWTVKKIGPKFGPKFFKFRNFSRVRSSPKNKFRE